MKNLIITVFLFICSYSVQGQLHFVESMNYLPVDFKIHDITVKSSSEIFMVGAKKNPNWDFTPAIYQSTDGGANWIEVISTGIDPSHGQFKNICYTGGRFLMFIENAMNVNPNDDSYEMGIYSSSNCKDWVLSNNGIVKGLNVNGITAKSSSEIYLFGYIYSPKGFKHYKLYKSTDGGVNWEEVLVSGIDGTLISYQSLHFTGDKFFLSTFTREFDNFTYTSPDGVNWTKLSNGILSNSFTVLDIASKSPSEIYLSGTENGRGTIYKSTDGGMSWSKNVGTGIEPLYYKYFKLRYTGDKFLMASVSPILSYEEEHKIYVSSSVPFTNQKIISLRNDLSFGEVGVIQTAYKVLVISNIGDMPLEIKNFDLPDGFSLEQWSSPGIILAPGESLNVPILFIPIEAKTYSGTITVQSNFTMGTNTIAVSGNGFGDPGIQRFITLSGDLSFGNTSSTNPAQKTFVIKNRGNSPMTITGFEVPDGFSIDWPGGVIASGESKNVTITFSPTEAKNYSGFVTVLGDFTMGTNTIFTWGTATVYLGSERVITLSGDLSFGNVLINQPAKKTLVIGNSGGASLTVSGLELPEGFSIDWAGGVIAPGESKNVTITFSPTEAKNYSGDLILKGDFIGGNSVIIASGTGIKEMLNSISLKGDLSFGNVVINQPAKKTLEIQNSGSTALTVSGIELPEGFLVNWTGGVIAAGQTQRVDITFLPSVGEKYEGLICIKGDFKDGKVFIAASGTGVISTANELLISTSLSFFPNPVQDKLTIRSESLVDQIVIYNVAGKMIFGDSFSDNEISIDMGRFPKGVYLVKVVSEGVSATFKIMKK